MTTLRSAYIAVITAWLAGLLVGFSVAQRQPCPVEVCASGKTVEQVEVGMKRMQDAQVRLRERCRK